MYFFCIAITLLGYRSSSAFAPIEAILICGFDKALDWIFALRELEQAAAFAAFLTGLLGLVLVDIADGIARLVRHHDRLAATDETSRKSREEQARAAKLAQFYQEQKAERRKAATAGGNLPPDPGFDALIEDEIASQRSAAK